MLNVNREDANARQLRSAVSELEMACQWHDQWYKRVLRSLVARVPPGTADLMPGAHQQCPFGRWYENACRSFLAQEQPFAEIRSKHEKMHAFALILLQRVEDDLPITPQQWDRYQDSVDDMRRDLQCLQAGLARRIGEKDPLTGALNRAVLEADLREQDAAVRRGIATCALAMLDLDHFKAVNDNFGHAAGDAVLVATVQCVKAVVRPYDRIYRYGGEEFLVSMPGITQTQAGRLAERIRAAVAAQQVALEASGDCIRVTASLGVAMHSASRSIEDTLQSADRAMYEAKARGRNRVVVAD